jgi:hypothetical protein
MMEKFLSRNFVLSRLADNTRSISSSLKGSGKVFGNFGSFNLRMTFSLR